MHFTRMDAPHKICRSKSNQRSDVIIAYNLGTLAFRRADTKPIEEQTKQEISH